MYMSLSKVKAGHRAVIKSISGNEKIRIFIYTSQ